MAGVSSSTSTSKQWTDIAQSVVNKGFWVGCCIVSGVRVVLNKGWQHQQKQITQLGKVYNELAQKFEDGDTIDADQMAHCLNLMSQEVKQIVLASGVCFGCMILVMRVAHHYFFSWIPVVKQGSTLIQQASWGLFVLSWYELIEFKNALASQQRLLLTPYKEGGNSFDKNAVMTLAKRLLSDINHNSLVVNMNKITQGALGELHGFWVKSDFKSQRPCCAALVAVFKRCAAAA